MQNKLTEFLSLVDVYKFQEHYAQDIDGAYFGFPLQVIIDAEKRLCEQGNNAVAYFSMEYGLATSIYNTFIKKEPVPLENKTVNHHIFSNMRIEDYLFDFQIDKIMDLPIYSGGLGVLAGDTLKSVADLGIPLAGIGILWSKGYFKQNFWFKYGQVPEETHWDPYSYPGLIPLNNIIGIKFNQYTVYLRLWKYYVYSSDKTSVVPLILLDSDLEQNPSHIRSLTGQLYKSSDIWVKLMQRCILGMGGIRALEELGYSIEKFHLNEGHAAMAFVEKAKGANKEELEQLQKRFIYTCHTPVAAGHDRFPLKELENVLPKENMDFMKKASQEADPQEINLTLLLLNNCRHVNSVSRKHQQITSMQFPQFKDKIFSVTNGVHLSTWASDNFLNLFDKYKDVLGDCRRDPENLKNVIKLKNDKHFRQDLWLAHQENKKILAEAFHHWHIKEDVFTLCWARRIAQYKRPSLIFRDPERLLSIAKGKGQLQIIIAGKAHPADNLVGTYIEEIMNAIDGLNKEFKDIRILMLENYDIYLGKLLTSCVDVWLNTPLPPFEASGTSGMKALLNGVVQVSTLDGWVVEAEDAGIGEIFGYRHKEGAPLGSEADLKLWEDSNELYGTLEKLVPMYYQTVKGGQVEVSSHWIDLMVNCIGEGHYFNSQRMAKEYRDRMWGKV